MFINDGTIRLVEAAAAQCPKLRLARTGKEPRDNVHELTKPCEPDCIVNLFSRCDEEVVADVALA